MWVQQCEDTWPHREISFWCRFRNCMLNPKRKFNIVGRELFLLYLFLFFSFSFFPPIHFITTYQLPEALSIAMWTFSLFATLSPRVPNSMGGRAFGLVDSNPFHFWTNKVFFNAGFSAFSLFPLPFDAAFDWRTAAPLLLIAGNMTCALFCMHKCDHVKWGSKGLRKKKCNIQTRLLCSSLLQTTSAYLVWQNLLLARAEWCTLLL